MTPAARTMTLAVLSSGACAAASMSDAVLADRIRVIKGHSRGGGQNVEEYTKFMRHVRAHAPQQLLVWGLGYDSTLIAELNDGGRTLFLEPKVDWVSRSSARNLTYVGYDEKRQLNTTVGTMQAFVRAPHRASISALDSGHCWDTILVDSPNGKWQHDPSRAAPIYTASVDVEACAARGAYPKDRPGATIFVHDCDRAGEDYLTRAILGPSFTETGGKKLREFRTWNTTR